MQLSDISKGRNNNLDLIRLIAAIMVVFCHAFPISLGTAFTDPLSTVSHGQTSFGNLAVCIFFFYGGFLIMGSAERSRTARSFFKKRISRLFPSLIAVVLLCVFVLGPILTTSGLGVYFSSSAAYKYLLNAVLIPIHDLPGVFTTNIYGQTVNGPLWTLPIEFLCYVLCFLLFRMHITEEKKMKYSLIAFLPGYFLMSMILVRIPVLKEALRPMGMFYVGMLYYVYRDKIKMNSWAALGATAVLCISIPFGILEYTVLFCLPYVLAYTAFAVPKPKTFLDGKADISYQLYLTAWPIQQILCQCFGGSMNPWLNFIIAVPCSIAAAIGIYMLVEKRIKKTVRTA
jgi:peptidoglycan/LPS O-acetylase OafA/YrhL